MSGRTRCARRCPSPVRWPSRVAETLAGSLVADPLFCDLLANVHPLPEHEVDLDRVVGIRRTSAAAAMSLAEPTASDQPKPIANDRSQNQR